MFKEYNQNPFDDNIDDCVVRAISYATGKDYWDVFEDLCELMDELNADYINVAKVFIPYIDSMGWELRELKSKMTVNQLSKKFNIGKLIVIVNGHMTVIDSGDIIDTWNCGRYKVQYVFVKEEDDNND